MESSFRYYDKKNRRCVCASKTLMKNSSDKISIRFQIKGSYNYKFMDLPGIVILTSGLVTSPNYQ